MCGCGKTCQTWQNFAALLRGKPHQCRDSARAAEHVNPCMRKSKKTSVHQTTKTFVSLRNSPVSQAGARHPTNYAQCAPLPVKTAQCLSSPVTEREVLSQGNVRQSKFETHRMCWRALYKPLIWLQSGGDVASGSGRSVRAHRFVEMAQDRVVGVVEPLGRVERGSLPNNQHTRASPLPREPDPWDRSGEAEVSSPRHSPPSFPKRDVLPVGSVSFGRHTSCRSLGAIEAGHLAFARDVANW